MKINLGKISLCLLSNLDSETMCLCLKCIFKHIYIFLINFMRKPTETTSVTFLFRKYKLENSSVNRTSNVLPKLNFN